MPTEMTEIIRGTVVLVDWELYGTRITPDALRATMQAHGYDPTIVPDIDEEAMVRSAGKKWQKLRQGFKGTVTEDDDYLYLQLLCRGEDGTLGAAGKAARRKFTQVAALVWDKPNGCWDGVVYQHGGAALDPVVAAMVKEYTDFVDRHRLYLDHDFIRPVLIQAPLADMGAVPFIRRSGGCRVVPAQNLPQLQKLAGLVNAIGDSYMGIVKADGADPGTAQAVTRSVRSNLADEIKAVRADLDDWRQRSKRLPTASIGQRINTFKDLRAKAQLYADSLGIMVKDLLTDIGDAEKDARDLLDRAMGRTPAPAPAEECDACDPQSPDGQCAEHGAPAPA